MVLGARHTLRIFLDAAAMAQLDVLDHVKLNAVRIVDVAVGIGGGHDLRAEGLSLLGGEDGHLPEPEMTTVLPSKESLRSTRIASAV